MGKLFLFNDNRREAGRRRRVRQFLWASVAKPSRGASGFLRSSADNAGGPSPHLANAHDRRPSGAFDRAALS